MLDVNNAKSSSTKLDKVFATTLTASACLPQHESLLNSRIFAFLRPIYIHRLNDAPVDGGEMAGSSFKGLGYPALKNGRLTASNSNFTWLSAAAYHTVVWNHLNEAERHKHAGLCAAMVFHGLKKSVRLYLALGERRSRYAVCSLHSTSSYSRPRNTSILYVLFMVLFSLAPFLSFGLSFPSSL